MTLLACVGTWLLRSYLQESSLLSLLPEKEIDFSSFIISQLSSFSRQTLCFSLIFFIGLIQLKQKKPVLEKISNINK